MFLGNLSSQCTSLVRVSILEEYNEDMFSFWQVSQDMFASTLDILFGPFLLRKHLYTKQIQTLRQARRANRSNQGFLKALHYAQLEGQVLYPTIMAAILQRSTEKRKTTAKELITRTFKCTYSKCIDNILRMGDQVEGYLETLIFLVTNLGFIINSLKSIRRQTQKIKYLRLPGEKLHHIRMELRNSNPPEITCDSSSAGTDNRETECIFSGSTTCSLIIPLLTRRPIESFEEQQSKLLSSFDIISASSRRVFLVTGEIGTLEWQSPSSP